MVCIVILNDCQTNQSTRIYSMLNTETLGIKTFKILNACCSFFSSSFFGTRLRFYLRLARADPLWILMYLTDQHVSTEWHASHHFKVIATSSPFLSDVVTHSFCWLVSTSKVITPCIWLSKIKFLSTCFWTQLFHQYMWIVLFLLPIKSRLTMQDTCIMFQAVLHMIRVPRLSQVSSYIYWKWWRLVTPYNWDNSRRGNCK